jgi:NAD(P)-dependent dehydrogenase (short-subunit alcohol dehydrogenase family)
MDRRFEGKVALVTGAATGIGQATAARLAADGAIVAVNHRPDQDPAETLGRIGAADGQGFAFPADMRDPEQVTAMVRGVASQAGRLDFVVSNAAVNPFMKWDETSLEDFNLLFETNVRGAWVVATEGAKQMIREGHGGAICCVSSISAHVGAPGQTAYCGTKGAISMLAKALACDLGEHGIRVNAVEPGWTITPMSAPLMDDPAALKYYTERIPLHRGAQPEELANAIAFMLSSEASYVTAATLLVDGGFIVNAEL